MSETTPRRSPVVRAWPTPNTLMVGWRDGVSPVTSAIIAVVFAEPISRPATSRSGFIAIGRSLDLDSGDPARRHVRYGAPDQLVLTEARPVDPLRHRRAPGRTPY